MFIRSGSLKSFHYNVGISIIFGPIVKDLISHGHKKLNGNNKTNSESFSPVRKMWIPASNRNNQQANRVADDNNRSNDENGMEIESSKLLESDSSVESAIVAEEVECDNIAEATNQHVSGSDSNQVDRQMPESEDTAGATGATNITVNYSGMQSRKGEMLKTGNVKMYSIEIS